MGWVARLSVVVAILSVALAPAVPLSPVQAGLASAAERGGTGRASEGSERSSKSERKSTRDASDRAASRAERRADKAERRAEKAERRAARQERRASRAGADRTDPVGEGATSRDPEVETPRSDETPTAVDGPVPAPGGPEPDAPEPEAPSTDDSAGATPGAEVPTEVDGPVPDDAPAPTPTDEAPAEVDAPGLESPGGDVPTEVDAPEPEAPDAEVPVGVDAPEPEAPDADAPTEIDGPAPEVEVPTETAGPDPASGDGDPTPSAPAPGATPDPAEPAAPVEVVEAPGDDVAAPEPGGQPVSAVDVAGEPDATGSQTDNDAVGGERATGSAADPKPLPSLNAILSNIFRGTPAEAVRQPPAPNVAPLPAPVAPALDVVVPVDAAPALADGVAEPEVEVEPSVAARAPRIELSSGGNGAETHRRYELTALGLTPRARQVITALGFRVISERRSPLLGNRVVARLRTPGSQTAEAALARARSVLPEVTFDLSHLYRPASDRVPVRYAAKMIGAPTGDACPIPTRIGLIDSGVGTHPTLAAAEITRKTFIQRDAATNVTHGTAVASILVGDLPGTGPLMPGAHLFSANVFTQDEKGLRADATAIIAALDWMAAERVPVVNLSLMGPSNALLEQAVGAAAARGLILVAAAGNDGPNAAPAFPAAYPAVIAVAAVDARGRPYARNNRGGYIYVTAPGVDIWGADARGGVAFWTGTSFAAPFVTASLARDLAQGRAHDVNDGRSRIAALARDLGAPGRDPIYGHGLLQSGGCAGGGSRPGGGAVLSSRD